MDKLDPDKVRAALSAPSIEQVPWMSHMAAHHPETARLVRGIAYHFDRNGVWPKWRELLGKVSLKMKSDIVRLTLAECNYFFDHPEKSFHPDQQCGVPLYMMMSRPQRGPATWRIGLQPRQSLFPDIEVGHWFRYGLDIDTMEFAPTDLTVPEIDAWEQFVAEERNGEHEPWQTTTWADRARHSIPFHKKAQLDRMNSMRRAAEERGKL